MTEDPWERLWRALEALPVDIRLQQDLLRVLRECQNAVLLEHQFLKTESARLRLESLQLMKELEARPLDTTAAAKPTRKKASRLGTKHG